MVADPLEKWVTHTQSGSAVRLHGQDPVERGMRVPDGPARMLFAANGVTSVASREWEIPLAEVLFQEGRRDHAVRLMSRALHRSPTAANYLRVLKLLLSEDGVLSARKIAQEAVSRFPSNAHLRKLHEVLRPPTVRGASGKAIDRSREVAWLREHREEYRGKWVVLSGDRLVSAANNLSEALEKAERYGLSERPLVHQVS